MMEVIRGYEILMIMRGFLWQAVGGDYGGKWREANVLSPKS